MNKSLKLLSAILLSAGFTTAHASETNPIPGNPIVETLRAADPDAHVWDGVVWMYASQDQEPGDPEKRYATMDGYHVFSSTDMVSWKDHGEILHSRDVSWGKEAWMWAPGAARKNGTYYLYYPHHDKTGQFRIGVATSQQPQGPFKDIGNYIEGTQGTDPMCFTDDDGQSYLYFGRAQVAKLKDNMTELAEPSRVVDYGAKNFGEGAWVFKRNGKYYYTYTNFHDKKNQGYYAIGDSPYGPFTFVGPLCGKPPGAQDHHSTVEYKGQWYYFYHVGNFNRGNFYKRNACVEKMFFNEDGTIQMVEYTTGVLPKKPATPSATAPQPPNPTPAPTEPTNPSPKPKTP